MILAKMSCRQRWAALGGARISGVAIGGSVSFEVIIEGCTFSFVLRSCSRIFGSGGMGRLLGSVSGEEVGGLGIGAGIG